MEKISDFLKNALEKSNKSQFPKIGSFLKVELTTLESQTANPGGKGTIHRSLREWADLAILQEQSGLNIPAWCLRNGIHIASFRDALKRIRRILRATKAEEQNSVTENPSVKTPTPEISKPAAESSSYIIEFGAFRVTIPSGVDEAYISKLCKILKNSQTSA